VVKSYLLINVSVNVVFTCIVVFLLRSFICGVFIVWIQTCNFIIGNDTDSLDTVQLIKNIVYIKLPQN